MELDKVAESIGAINTPSVGIAGEVRCVVTGADGTIKTDTGYQKNLILNQGLDFFGGGKGSYINASCAIGSGNSAPAITQTKLDAYIAQADGTNTTSDYGYVDKGDNAYRVWQQKKYRFTGLANVNISEVGLVSTGTTSTTYYLTTRALIKDSLGAPTSISVKTGETLDIYYKIYKVIDTRDKSFVVNVLDGNGGSVPYNVIVRPSLVGIAKHANFSSLGNVAAGGSSYEGSYSLFTQEIASMLNLPATTGAMISGDNILVQQPYVVASYKKGASLSFDLNQANGNIRSAYIPTSLGLWQMRFGRVSDDAPITKTANDTLSIPLEFSWGRFEGIL